MRELQNLECYFKSISLKFETCLPMCQVDALCPNDACDDQSILYKHRQTSVKLQVVQFLKSCFLCPVMYRYDLDCDSLKTSSGDKD